MVGKKIPQIIYLKKKVYSQSKLRIIVHKILRYWIVSLHNAMFMVNYKYD